MEKSKKNKSLLKRFAPYMGKRKILIPIALISSAISSILSAMPYIFIWLVIKEVLKIEGSISLNNIMPFIYATLISSMLGILFYFVALIASHLAAFRVEIGLQKLTLEKIINKPLGYFDERESGMIRKIVNEGAVSTHGFIAHQLPDIAATMLTPLVLLIMVFYVDLKLGLIFLIPIIIGMIILSQVMNDTARKFMDEYYNSLEEMSSEAVEYIRGINVVKTFAQSVFSFKKFTGSISTYKKNVMLFTMLWKNKMSLFNVIMMSGGLFLVPGALIIMNASNAANTITDLIFYLIIAPNFIAVVMKSMYFKKNNEIATRALEKIENLLNYNELIYDKDEKPNSFDIEFKDVHFGYKEDLDIIKGISFKVKQGEKIALVGASGSGKTTTLRLAARFWDVKKGEITIGGINIKNISKENLMDYIAFVFQNTNLLSKSLKENITMGNNKYSIEEINKAVDNSMSREIIDSLNDGLDTIIGSKGTYLSGGEKQRICLARAILKNSPIVLLDEATAFADPENEHLIQEALKTIIKDKTTIIIAHRLETIKDADRILVIDEGRIVEEGSHDELLRNGSFYSDMYNDYIEAIKWNLRAKGGKNVK